MLHLASASPRRRAILDALGLRFSYAGTDIDESISCGESAENLVARLALTKARAARDARPDAVILGADTVVAFGDRILGKPESKEDALDMLATLSGETHDVLTAVVALRGDCEQRAVSRSLVSFRQVEPAEASAYWESGEPLDKAGGYAIQGLAAVFIEELRGSYSGVMGMPIFETAQLLSKFGIEILTNNTRGPNP
ncbi:MAG: septum formation inhibitor Maf [Woeseia sp.]|nr:septum formation inhibitor Maf [Woeseia sp.]MBT8097313.1 septum formation inhibitor Maf [Woeseia sp.]NNE61006.1 septum formation inhibitor Maf [Woeseia sp.]NNL53608.1 septum formation inhibitor Maf [Woeseia sp.]